MWLCVLSHCECHLPFLSEPCSGGVPREPWRMMPQPCPPCPCPCPHSGTPPCTGPTNFQPPPSPLLPAQSPHASSAAPSPCLESAPVCVAIMCLYAESTRTAVVPIMATVEGAEPDAVFPSRNAAASSRSLRRADCEHRAHEHMSTGAHERRR